MFREFYHSMMDQNGYSLERGGNGVMEILHVPTFRGAHIESDHYLVMAKIRSQISREKRLKATNGNKLGKLNWKEISELL